MHAFILSTDELDADDMELLGVLEELYSQHTASL
jgi:hypothetical protein